MAIEIGISSKFPTFFSKSIGSPNCASADPESFFPEKNKPDIKQIAMARKVCSTCPYIKECREWAIDHHEVGVWGGTTEMDRKRIRRARKVELSYK